MLRGSSALLSKMNRNVINSNNSVSWISSTILFSLHYSGWLVPSLKVNPTNYSYSFIFYTVEDFGCDILWLIKWVLMSPRTLCLISNKHRQAFDLCLILGMREMFVNEWNVRIKEMLQFKKENKSEHDQLWNIVLTTFSEHNYESLSRG